MEIKKVITKNGKEQFYKYSLNQMRSFRIAKAEAELLVAAGEAILVNAWWYERTAEENAEVSAQWEAIEAAKTAETDEIVEVTEVQAVEVAPVVNEEVTAANVIDFTTKRQEKQRKEDVAEAFEYFKNEVYPNLNRTEVVEALNSESTEGFAEILKRGAARAIMKRSARI